ncbi:RYamide receptor-like isoform X2 [Brevipalpus obovatus]|uniref:RYamide receptor-like isoform X2 n=1 Tax=Brevipalpus obovatus TaxID=246614 RepID=UPI003D9F594A
MALEPDPSFMVNNPNHHPINGDEHHIGLPQIIDAFDEPLQVFFIFLYTMTAVLALAGNITAIWVLMVGKRSSRDLRTFLVNLALSDVAMALFSIPFTYTSYMLDRWIFHPLFCPFVQFMTCLSVFVSVYTLIAIGIDRYFAIMNPLNCARWTKARSRLIVIFIWIVGTALSSSQLMVSKAMPATGSDNSTIYQCRELWESVWAERTYTAIIFCITFALPMSILMFTYSSIGWKMLHHTTPGNANTARDIAQFEAKMKVVKMLAVVVVLFILCWLPLHIFNVLYWFDAPIFPPTDSGRRWQNAIFFLCHWLAMANSFLNPIVYCFMSDNFREIMNHHHFVIHHILMLGPGHQKQTTTKPTITVDKINNHNHNNNTDSNNNNIHTNTLNPTAISSCQIKKLPVRE